MIYLYYALAVVLAYFSFRSMLGGRTFLRYFREKLEAPLSDFTPFASVIVPCRGIDPGLRENLTAMMRQDYPRYEVIFVVDDLDDPAVSVIQSVTASGGPDSRLVIASAAATSGQKVENLREAVANVHPDSRVFVFVDSDTRAQTHWLRCLIDPLERQDIGASTGYRWFIAKEPDLASELRSVWNASIASALGPNERSNFCWGGSMALRRDTFERLGIRDRWAGTLSDDFTVTRILREAGLSIVFVPQAVTATLENCTFIEMLEFTTRQMKITRVYAESLWLMSFVGSALFTLVMLISVLLMFSGSWFNAVFATVIVLLVSGLSVAKAELRLRAIRLVLPQYNAALGKQFWIQNTLWLLTPLIFLFNCVCALLSRKMTWRGTRSELKSSTVTVIIGRVPGSKD